ncbi:beta-N-acetylhexosaminidase [Mucilaginibacter sp. SMC90]|uniref:beta-N-acetylhexosaminidase n=1 Tax=Mucilaginibacter sp. SMC90 TaxID=2929803 RepID=UPI001FB31477|nr:beta-N-acetylhexosaminidase [Mucilaginibacter sp. SMC90]UOE46610.1 beta-N-acetylhexosaminidase [Mucilaginibacter sp. SMC90]
MKKPHANYLNFAKRCLLLVVLFCAVIINVYGQDNLKVKAFHVDLRIQVMTMPALKQLALKLHNQGINTLIMEWEGSFPYNGETVISNKYAYSRAEVKDFIKYCDGLHIDVIPLQQTFGHVEYILRHYKYAALREDDKDFSQVCPSEPELNRELFTKLIKDMISLHDSPYVHIGGDETFLLGHCEKCKKKAAEVGLSRLYFDHIKLICDIVNSLGKKPVVWADIALKYPDYIHLLPKGTVFVDWNYGWDPNLFGDRSKLLASGYEVWGAPAIRSEPDNFYIEKWSNHFENIRNFVPQIKSLHYQGVVMTSWSTSGAYSTVFDSNDDAVALYPVRRVYPLSAFNLLITAYTEAVKSNQPLDISVFIRSYCKTNYGFNPADADLFKKALFTAPYPVMFGKVKGKTNLSLDNLVDSTRSALSILNKLKPQKNLQEFEHYRLMAEIRLLYLNTLQLEAVMNGDQFNEGTKGKYRATAISLKQQSAKLDEKFDRLNGGFIQAGELADEKALRNAKINELFDKLVR